MGRIGTAAPIGISIHQESNIDEMNLDSASEQVLILTKMRYNNVEQGVREPISTYFARAGDRFVASMWNQYKKEIDILMEKIDARFFL